MSPRNNLATIDAEEEGCLRRHKAHKLNQIEEKERKKKKKRKMKMKKKKKKKKKTVGMKLEEDEANKSLYICYLNSHPGKEMSYDVRAIKVSDLLTSSSFDHPLQLPQAAYKSGSDLPGSVGCGVWGSKIIFVGGMKPSVPWYLGSLSSKSIVWNMGVFGFETQHNEEQEDKNELVSKMDATFNSLQAPKFYPFVVDVYGKLYALSYRVVKESWFVEESPSFEVFDPKVGSWAVLPQPPFFRVRSPYYDNCDMAYAVAGTKMFVSHRRCPVFCFDVAHPHREWRRVPTMCGGGPFPFVRQALVLDLPDESNKIMFAYDHDAWRLQVYLMSLVENEESVRRIGYLRMPELPLELGHAKGCHICHIGGQKACIVVSEMRLPCEDRPEYEPGVHKIWGVAIPFEFEVDMRKVHKGKEDCFTLQFMSPCIFNYHTNPSTFPLPETAGCFVL